MGGWWRGARRDRLITQPRAAHNRARARARRAQLHSRQTGIQQRREMRSDNTLPLLPASVGREACQRAWWRVACTVGVIHAGLHGLPLRGASGGAHSAALTITSSR